MFPLKYYIVTDNKEVSESLVPSTLSHESTIILLILLRFIISS